MEPLYVPEVEPPPPTPWLKIALAIVCAMGFIGGLLLIVQVVAAVVEPGGMQL